MTDPADPNQALLRKWPFFAANLMLLATAGIVWSQASAPLSFPTLLVIAACIALGALLSVVPFVLEQRALTRLAEVRSLTTAAQIKNLETVAAQIAAATAQWQTVQEQATQTAGEVKQVTARMTNEANAFAQFIERANDSEKATLRLEVEKLRRAEAESMQVLARMLDHVYALHQGAIRSRQPHLIDQISQFQLACRDAARRVGLAPFVPAQAERFDGQRHQLADGQQRTSKGFVAETLAPGYTFQGKLVRPALVRLQEEEPKDENLVSAE